MDPLAPSDWSGPSGGRAGSGSPADQLPDRGARRWTGAGLAVLAAILGGGDIGGLTLFGVTELGQEVMSDFGEGFAGAGWVLGGSLAGLAAGGTASWWVADRWWRRGRERWAVILVAVLAAPWAALLVSLAL